MLVEDNVNYQKQITDLEIVLTGQCLWCKETQTGRANKILCLEFDLENCSGA